MKLFLDFESKSRCDLKKAGAYRYAEDPSTRIICMAYAVDDGPVLLLTPDSSTDEWNEFFKLANKADHLLAHNCGFERSIWANCLPAPLPPLDKWRDSAAQAAACCLPRSLGEACEAIGAEHKKDVSARSLMLKLSKPNKKGEFVGTPDEFARLYEYCKQDVIAERALAKALPPLSAGEQALWALDQAINDRGIPMDARFLRGVLGVLGAIDKDRLEQIRVRTSGIVDSPRQVAILGGWLRSQGCRLKNLMAGTVRDYLASGKATPEVAAVLKLRQELSKSSTAKYSAALACLGKGDRIRGSLLFYGANTGRWAGRLLQPHNLPRCKLSAEALDDKVFDLFAGTDTEPMTTASMALRSAISSPLGLTWGDLDQIEARTLPWLAGDLAPLDAFRKGEDVYIAAAADIYAKPKESIDKESDERQIGKVATLALGYGGGIGAFATMAIGTYHLDLSRMVPAVMARATPAQLEKGKKAVARYLKMAEEPIPEDQALACDLVKQFWRRSRPETVKFWYALADMAEAAVNNPLKKFRIGSISMGMYQNWLTITLPSGRRLYYFQPRIDDKGNFSCMRNQAPGKKTAGGWMRVDLHGGIFAENVTQAVSRDVLCESMLAMEREGIPVVLTVHDEIVAEGNHVEAMKRIMGTQIAWAPGLPIAAKIGQGRRYGK